MARARSIQPIVYALVGCCARAFAVHEALPPDPPKPHLLNRVPQAVRIRHYDRRTVAAYVAWVRRHIFFHGRRHLAELGAPGVTRFLSELAAQLGVAATTQNRALSYPHVLNRGPAGVGSPADESVHGVRSPKLYGRQDMQTRRAAYLAWGLGPGLRRNSDSASPSSRSRCNLGPQYTAGARRVLNFCIQIRRSVYL